MDQTQPLRDQLIENLRTSHARVSLEKALDNIPAHLLGETPHGLPYSIWQLAEHLRIAQWDILEFSRSAHHVSPKWPDDYWPPEKAPVDEAAWQHSLRQIAADRDAFTGLLRDEERDLFTPFPWGEGQTLLREALLIIDHNSYHLGEIVLLRRLLGAWGS